jgi:galactose mutarotase-like enzyme
VVGADADVAEARLAARFDFAAQPELMRLFPFAHQLVLDVRLQDSRLTIATTLSATGDGPVPVAFGFHPYFRLPGVPRAEWWVELPVRRAMAVDARQLPTDVRTPVSIPPGPLGDRSFDTPYDELDPVPTFVLAGGGRRIAVTFDEGYPCTQVFAPPGQDFICFEPMTAPPDALVRGGPELQIVPPGGCYRAVFSIDVTPVAPR